MHQQLNLFYTHAEMLQNKCDESIEFPQNGNFPLLYELK